MKKNCKGEGSSDFARPRGKIMREHIHQFSRLQKWSGGKEELGLGGLSSPSRERLRAQSKIFGSCEKEKRGAVIILGRSFQVEGLVLMRRGKRDTGQDEKTHPWKA